MIDRGTRRGQAEPSPILVVDSTNEEVDRGEVAAERAKQAKRLAKEKKNPQAARARARDETMREEMESDLDDAKQDARDSGERWSDVKEEWIAQWIADNWDDVREAEFDKAFRESNGRPITAPTSPILEERLRTSRRPSGWSRPAWWSPTLGKSIDGCIKW
jgi:hypothetical protein